MAKVKPVRPKSKRIAAPQGGIGCIVLLCSGIALLLLFFYFIMKYAT
jgi:hypothetical protein